MNIPAVLEQIRPSDDWGPCATTYSSYADFAAAWRGQNPCPTLKEMQDAWTAIQANGPSQPEKDRAIIKAFAAIPNPQLPDVIAVLQAHSRLSL